MQGSMVVGFGSRVLDTRRSDVPAWFGQIGFKNEQWNRNISPSVSTTWPRLRFPNSLRSSSIFEKLEANLIHFTDNFACLCRILIRPGEQTGTSLDSKNLSLAKLPAQVETNHALIITSHHSAESSGQANIMKLEGQSFNSSPAVGPNKRTYSDALDESPSANRAKRVKHRNGRKRRSKHSGNPDGSAIQGDWLSSDPNHCSPRGGSTSVKCPIQFPPKAIYEAHMPKSAGKLNASKKDLLGGNNDSNASARDSIKHDTPKTAANIAKARAERDSDEDMRQKTKKNGVKSSPFAQPEEDPLPKAIVEFISSTRTPVKAGIGPPGFSHKRAKEAISGASVNSTSGNATSENNKGCFTTTSPPPTPASAPAPAGTKTLKSISRRLKSLEAKLTSLTTTVPSTANTAPSAPSSPVLAHAALHPLRAEIADLHQRLDVAELRATVRHEMLFNALTKISADVCRRAGHELQLYRHRLQQQQQEKEREQGGEDHDSASAAAAAPAANTAVAEDPAAAAERRSASMRQARKTLEQCLRSFTDDMNQARTAEDVAKYGGFCVREWPISPPGNFLV
ncbi:hypothetical protein VTK26DRAFT_5488 [Humicola hyalothermophila]